jgi:hypothetical protein
MLFHWVHRTFCFQKPSCSKCNKVFDIYSFKEKPCQEKEVVNIGTTNKKVKFGGPRCFEIENSDPEIPHNISEAIDDLDNDCIKISERATLNAELLTDLMDLIMVDIKSDSPIEMNTVMEATELE